MVHKVGVGDFGSSGGIGFMKSDPVYKTMHDKDIGATGEHKRSKYDTTMMPTFICLMKFNIEAEYTLGMTLVVSDALQTV